MAAVAPPPWTAASRLVADNRGTTPTPKAVGTESASEILRAWASRLEPRWAGITGEPKRLGFKIQAGLIH